MKNVIITILLVFFAAGGLTAEKSPAKSGQDEIVLPTIKIEKSNAQSDVEASLLVKGSIKAEAKNTASTKTITPVKVSPPSVHSTSEVD